MKYRNRELLDFVTMEVEWERRDLQWKVRWKCDPNKHHVVLAMEKAEEVIGKVNEVIKGEEWGLWENIEEGHARGTNVENIFRGLKDNKLQKMQEWIEGV